MRQEIRGNEGNPDERECFESDSQGEAGGNSLQLPQLQASDICKRSGLQ